MLELAHVRHFCCPLTFVAAHWALLLSDPWRLLLLASLPGLGPLARWANHADVVVGLLAVTVGMPPPPQRGEGDSVDETPLEMIAEAFREADARRTTYDRVGTYVVVAVAWVGSSLIIFPTLAACFRPVWRGLLKPIWRLLHRLGALEPLAYVAALVLSAQGFRYAPSQSSAWFAEVASLLGGGAFAPCWAYSVSLHWRLVATKAMKDEERRQLFWSHFRVAFMQGALMQAAVLSPLAVAVGSSLIGFLAVFAAYAGSVAALFRRRNLPGPYGLLVSSASVSFFLSLLAFAAARRGSGGPFAALTARLLPPWLLAIQASSLEPFSVGAALFGHVFYFACIVLLSSAKWKNSVDAWRSWQSLFIASVGFAMLVGWWTDAPAMRATAITFVLIWLLMKESEVDTETTTFKAGVQLGTTVVLVCYLVVNWEQVAAIFNPQNLYA